jgi:hypothetical protein
MSLPMGGTLYGYAIDSDLPLERLRSGRAPRGTLTVRNATAPLLGRRGRLVRYHRDLWALARTDDGLVIWCPGTGVYHAAPAAGVVQVEPDERYDGLLEHRLTTLVLPLLLAERGDLALHAAVIGVDGHAVAFCGASMRGKSTLAAELAARGHALLGDDSAVLTFEDDAFVAWPGPVGSRLRDPGELIMRRLVHHDRGHGDVDALPLAAVVVLGERGGVEPRLERMEPVRAATELYAHAPQADGAAIARTFALSARLVERVPVFEGFMPDDLAGAGEHAEALLRASLRG